MAGSAHAVLSAFPAWEGAKLLCALAQAMYWFLVMRADEGHRRGDLGAVKGKKIGAAPWVDYGLKRMLQEVRIDIERDEVDVAPVPGAVGPGVGFGATEAKALEDRLIDGFWPNGMGAEIAVTRGVGTIVVDVRRGDGPKLAFNYTQPVLVTTERFIAERPDDILSTSGRFSSLESHFARGDPPVASSDILSTTRTMGTATTRAEGDPSDSPVLELLRDRVTRALNPGT